MHPKKKSQVGAALLSALTGRRFRKRFVDSAPWILMSYGYVRKSLSIETGLTVSSIYSVCARKAWVDVQSQTGTTTQPAGLQPPKFL